jgi:hypothetical protein
LKYNLLLLSYLGYLGSCDPADIQLLGCLPKQGSANSWLIPARTLLTTTSAAFQEKKATAPVAGPALHPKTKQLSEKEGK